MRRNRTLYILTMLAASVFSFQAALGQIKGKVKLTALPPALAPQAVTKNSPVCGMHVLNESLLVSKKLEVRNAIVFLANIAPDSLPPVETGVKISQCVFHPHVSAVLRGDALVLESEDATLHHARGYLYRFRDGWERTVTKDIFDESGESVFNFALPAKATSGREPLRESGLLEIRSEIGYDWMKAYVLVMPHRFFAITDAKGEFELPRVPPGQFDLVLWHETLGVKRQLVEVAPGKKTELLIDWEMMSLEDNEDDSSAQAQKK